MADDIQPTTTYVNMRYVDDGNTVMEVLGEEAKNGEFVYELSIASGNTMTRLEFTASQFHALSTLLQASLTEVDLSGSAWLSTTADNAFIVNEQEKSKDW